MHVVATMNSLFETTDESCLLIRVIPTVLLIDPRENCASFVIKADEIGYFSAFSFIVSDNRHFSGFSFMVSDNSTFIFYCPRYPPGKAGYLR